MLHSEQEDIVHHERGGTAVMKQPMQFEQEPVRPRDQASSPEMMRAAKPLLKATSSFYPRSLRLLGLLLVVLGALLVAGLYLSGQMNPNFFLLLALVIDVLLFLGFWLLFKKRKSPAPHE